MSVDVFVFLRGSDLPSTQAWQRRIDEMSLGVLLSPSLDTATHSGRWTVEIDGEKAGFEYEIGPPDEVFGGELPPGASEMDTVVNLITRTSMLDLKCSMLCAAALADLAGGVVFDEDTGGVMSPGRFLEQARHVPA